MNSGTEKLLAVVAVLCAVTLTGLAVRREFGGGSAPKIPAGEKISRELMADLVRSPLHVVGDPQAPVTLVEFFDFECPACRRFSLTLDSVLKKSPSALRVVRRHYPLTAIHANAEKLALAGVCLAKDGLFEEYYHTVFASWGALGEGMGLRGVLPPSADTAATFSCMKSPDTWAVIERDAELGRSIRVSVTPTYVVNGRVFAGSRSVAQLEDILRRAKR
jgi:protein-disulfide isomerase